MPIIDRNYVFDFGAKHKGDHIDDVLKSDPQYIVWCIENIDWFEATDMVEKLAYDNAAEKKRKFGE